jgi:homopolymeric O-antigen transport system permease protein
MSAVSEQGPRRTPRTKEFSVYAIEPYKHGALPRMREAWYHRSLMGHMATQFIIKRYRATYLGWFWIFLRPGIQILTTSFFFGGVLALQYGERPALIFISFSQAAWTLFDRSFHWGMRSVRMTRSVSKSLHLPRSLASASAAAPAVVDFLIHSILAFATIGYYMIKTRENFLAPIPQWPIGLVGLLMLLIFGLATGLFTGPLMDVTKEVRYLQMYLIQFWMMVTPIVFDADHIPDKYRTLVEYNPLTGPVEMVQFGFLSTSPPSTTSMITSFVALVAFVIGGFAFSSRFERAAVARL